MFTLRSKQRLSLALAVVTLAFASAPAVAVELTAVSASWSGRYLFTDQLGAQAHLGFSQWIRAQAGLSVGFKAPTPIAALDLDIGPGWHLVEPFLLLGGTFTVIKSWSTVGHFGAGLRIRPFSSLFISAEA